MKINKKEAVRLREVNYDLFGLSPAIAAIIPETVEAPSQATGAGTDLPSLAELYILFDKLNLRMFNDGLPRLKIVYSDRMLTAGSFRPADNEIKIGRKYHRIFLDDIEDTLAHEMIHFLYPNHGPQFKEFARRFGISIKAREHPDLRLPGKYLYYCPSCGKEYPRRKRLRMAFCGVCTKGRKFDKRFKLVLKKK